jgi:2-phosphosulfolactate phosphatase
MFGRTARAAGDTFLVAQGWGGEPVLHRDHGGRDQRAAGSVVRIEVVDLPEAGRVTGTVVVIDVLRAFTTAAFAFAAGVREIRPVATIDQARQQRAPEVLLLGEDEGLPAPAPTFDNSPAAMTGRHLAGVTLMQRTTAGTQGLVTAAQADHLVAASPVCAAASAAALRDADRVTLVVTGSRAPDGSDEDRACAEYLAALLHGRDPDPGPYLDRVRSSAAAEKFHDPDQPAFPAAGLDCCVEVDRFSFAMPVQRHRDGLVMRRT